MWLATEKCYNELFSLARKVIILLISFKLPQPHVNRGVLHPSSFQIIRMSIQVGYGTSGRNTFSL